MKKKIFWIPVSINRPPLAGFHLARPSVTLSAQRLRCSLRRIWMSIRGSAWYKAERGKVMAASKPELESKGDAHGRVAFVDGRGELPMLEISTPWSTAEIYLHGAQVTHFKKT